MASTADLGAGATPPAADRRRLGLVAGEVALVVAALALVVVGFRAVARTTEGRAVDPVVDPREPGYEAFVEPTPTLAVVGRRADGSLDWVAVLVLGGAGRRGGTVVLVPPDLGVETPSGTVTLATADAGFGAAGVRSLLAGAQRAGIDEVVEVGPSRLASLLAGVGDLSFANPDAVGAIPAGPVVLAPDDAAAFLEAVEEGESQLTRLSRHEAFWQAWLAAVAGSTDPGAVPGETTSGLGRFLRGLAAGPSTVAVPALEPVDVDGQASLVAPEGSLVDFAEEHIPFPAAPEPGARVVVRVLDGVGADELAARTARDVVRAGGQVVIVGNAERFDPDAPTRVVFTDDVHRAAAASLAEALGVTAEQVDADGADAVYDVTVVAGSDRLRAYGLPVRAPDPADDDQDPT